MDSRAPTPSEPSRKPSRAGPAELSAASARPAAPPRQLDRLLRAIVEASPDPVVVAERGVLVQASAASARMFELDAVDELIGRPVSELVALSEREPLERQIEACAHGDGAARVHETVGRRRDGREFPLEVRMSRLESEGDASVVAFLRDVTDARAVERSLRERDRQVREILESIQEIYFRVGQDGRFLLLSASAPEIYGYASVDEMLAVPAVSLFADPRDHDRLLADLQTAGRVRDRMGRARRKDGSELWVSVSARQVRDDQGRTVAIEGATRDLTDRVLLTQQAHQAQKMEAIGQLTGGVAHDFNNLLAGMMIQCDQLRTSRSMAPADRQVAGELFADICRGATLTRQLLLFSRRSVMERRPVDLNDVLARLGKMLRRLIPEHVVLRFVPGPEPVVIDGDSAMIEQVLVNLAINARDAMPAGGEVTIVTSAVDVGALRARAHGGARPGPYVQLAVSDSGCGMDEPTLRRVFEPFFTTKEPGKGTGLGLTTVQSIVQQHGGWVEVDSDVGQGSRFRVLIPASVATSRPSEPPASSDVPGGSETILLVEDVPQLRRAMAASLRAMGYTIIEASTGAEALELWRGQAASIDLLLSDVVMPGGVSGVVLATKLCADKPELKVVLTSGYSEEVLGRSGHMPAGAVFLPKPQPRHVVAQVLRRCLDGR